MHPRYKYLTDYYISDDDIITFRLPCEEHRCPSKDIRHEGLSLNFEALAEVDMFYEPNHI